MKGFKVYVYDVVINGKKERHEIPNKLDYKKTIANFKKSLGEDAKVFIKLVDTYYWA